MIECEQLTRSFGSTLAVDELDLEIPGGKIVALLGPNGAGKTTTLNMLTTLLAPSSGTARVEGFDIVREGDRVRRLIGYVPEHGALYEGLSAREYLELAGRIRELTPDEIQRRSERFLEYFDLAEAGDRMLGTFSKGMRRKVLVSASLLHEPEVVFLDEPMDGLDVKSQKRLGVLLGEQVERGCTVIYSSHVLQQVEELCEHVVLIHEGKLRWQGPLHQLQLEHEGLGLRDIYLELTEEED